MGTEKGDSLISISTGGVNASGCETWMPPQHLLHGRPTLSSEAQGRAVADRVHGSQPLLAVQPVAMHSDSGTEGNGRYGWVIVASVFIIQMSFGGQSSLYGVYLPELTSHFRKSQVAMGTIGSVDMAVISITGIFSGQLVKRLGNRAVSILGLLLTAAGICGSSFCQTYPQLVATMGGIKSFGTGLYVIPINIIVQQHFTERRSLAAGISSTGLSLGYLFMPPVHSVMIESHIVMSAEKQPYSSGNLSLPHCACLVLHQSSPSSLAPSRCPNPSPHVHLFARPTPEETDDRS